MYLRIRSDILYKCSYARFFVKKNKNLCIIVLENGQEIYLGDDIPKSHSSFSPNNTLLRKELVHN